jgi:hypothetical protein
VSEIKLPDCECVVHTEDRNGTHGGAPHIHYCERHQRPELRPLDEEAVRERLGEVVVEWVRQNADPLHHKTELIEVATKVIVTHFGQPAPVLGLGREELVGVMKTWLRTNPFSRYDPEPLADALLAHPRNVEREQAVERVLDAVGTAVKTWNAWADVHPRPVVDAAMQRAMHELSDAIELYERPLSGVER